MKQVNIRCNDIELPAWKNTAGKQGVSAWLRSLADAASGVEFTEIKRGRPYRPKQDKDVETAA